MGQGVWGKECGAGGMEQEWRDSNPQPPVLETGALPLSYTPKENRKNSDNGDARERVMGIEPTRPAWKAGTLPLSYTRD